VKVRFSRGSSKVRIPNKMDPIATSGKTKFATRGGILPSSERLQLARFVNAH